MKAENSLWQVLPSRKGNKAAVGQLTVPVPVSEHPPRPPLATRFNRGVILTGKLHGKNGFVTATKLETTNEFFVASTKNFAAARKRFVDRTKPFVVVTKYFCYPYFNKWICWYNKTLFPCAIFGAVLSFLNAECPANSHNQSTRVFKDFPRLTYIFSLINWTL